MKKPINPDTLARLVSNIRSNLDAFEKDDPRSTDYAELVMGLLTGLMRDGHVIYVSIFPQNNVTEIWTICIDTVMLVKGGVLRDEIAVPHLLKKGRS